MNNKYSSVFDSIHAYVKGSSNAAWLFLMAVVILVIGVNGFAEDTYSSYVGFHMIEETFNVRPATWEATYWFMSLSFQVATVVCFFAYMSDRVHNWWGMWAAVGFQIADGIADVWYRSNGVFDDLSSVGVSLILTLLFFTFGSEIAVTFGLGLTSKLAVEGLTQWSIIIRNLITGIGQFMQVLASGKPGDKGSTDSSVSHSQKDFRFQPPNNPVGGNTPLNPPLPQQKPTNNGSRPEFRHPFQVGNNQQQQGPKPK